MEEKKTAAFRLSKQFVNVLFVFSYPTNDIHSSNACFVHFFQTQNVIIPHICCTIYSKISFIGTLIYRDLHLLGSRNLIYRDILFLLQPPLLVHSDSFQMFHLQEFYYVNFFTYLRLYFYLRFPS